MLLSLAVFRLISENSALKKGAILQKDAASLNEQGAEQLVANIGHQKEIFTATTTLAETAATHVGTLIVDSVEIGFEEVAQRVAVIEERQDKIATILNNVINAIEKHDINF